MEHFIVYKRAGRYASFPHVTIAANGDLLVVFREAGAATAAAALRGTHTHQDIDSRILFTRSWDRGASWTEPVVVYEGDYAVSDPAVTVLRDGQIIVRFARWLLAPIAERGRLPGPVMRHFPHSGEVGMMAGNGFAYSEDDGQSWVQRASEVRAPDLERAESREPILEMPDGSWLLSVYDGYPFRSDSAWLLRSWDGGHTWEDPSPIAGHFEEARPYRQAPNFNETAVLPLDEHTLLAVLRVDGTWHTEEAAYVSEGGLGELRWTISYDLGFTWETPHKTALWGQPANLLCLADGRLLCTYGYRRAPYGIRASMFEIDHREWRTVACVALRDDGLGWDVGYPASTQLPDGQICTVYYIYGQDKVRHVACTLWRVDEMEPVRP